MATVSSCFFTTAGPAPFTCWGKECRNHEETEALVGPHWGSRPPVPGLCSLSTSGSERLCLNPSQMQSSLDCGKPAGLRPVTHGAEPSSSKNFSRTIFFLPRQSSRILKAQVSHTRSLPGSVSSPSTTKRGNNFKQVPLFGLRGSDLRQGSVN